MKAFLTGSQAYGSPTDKSDIDLVIDLKDADFSGLVCAVNREEIKVDCYDDTDLNLKFGRLNLIVPGSRERLRAWKRGTKALMKRVRVSGVRATREEAGAEFKRQFESEGLQ